MFSALLMSIDVLLAAPTYPDSYSGGGGTDNEPTPGSLIPAAEIEYSGTWEQEWAVETDGIDSQKFESIVQPRIDIDFANGTSLTGIGRLRLDTVGDLGPDENRPPNYSSVNGPIANDSHAGISLRELYLDLDWLGGLVRLGKQQVVWGQADGIKVLDVVNPQSFREFILDDFDSSRIPLWSANLEFPIGKDGTLQLLFIPDTTYHEYAELGTPYFLTSPFLVPEAPPGNTAFAVKEADKPDGLEDSDAGFRYSSFVGGWDLTFNYLYHYQDSPAFYTRILPGPTEQVVEVSPKYERSNLIGSTISNVFGDVTLRAEIAYSTDTYQVSSDPANGNVAETEELASVIGLDWQLSDYDTLLSGQWFQSTLLDYDGRINRDETEHNISLLYQRDFDNETWNFNALVLYSPSHGDALLQAKLNYLFSSNIDIWLGADIFGGDDDGYYGQFSDRDRILVGFQYSF